MADIRRLEDETREELDRVRRKKSILFLFFRVELFCWKKCVTDSGVPRDDRTFSFNHAQFLILIYLSIFVSCSNAIKEQCVE